MADEKRPAGRKRSAASGKNGEPDRINGDRRTAARRQAEKALQKSRRLLEAERNLLATLVENITDAIYFKDAGSRFIRINRNQARRFGLSDPEQAVGKTDFHYFSAEHARAAFEDEQAIIRTGEPVVGKEEKETWPDGRTGWVSTTKMPLRDAEGKIIGTFGISRDITERVQRQADLQRKNEQLETTLDQLRATQARLVQQEKLASIGNLAAGVAHELNNPIGFISSNFSVLSHYVATLSGYIATTESLLKSGAAAETSGLEALAASIEAYKQEKKIEFILHDIPELLNESREGIERITSIVQNLRQFSRVDYESKFDPYDINQGLENTLVVARNEIKYVADVVKEFGDIPAVECVAGEINQVFLNILINAAQAIAGQRRAEKGRITVRTRVEGAGVVCEFEDDGPGIPADVIGRVFDPFFTTKEAGRGTGLGLNISYDIVVNKHGGELTVSSDLGRGTRFTVKLPVSQNRNAGEENDGR
jgi:PAS domain S-box-containing protein